MNKLHAEQLLALLVVAIFFQATSHQVLIGMGHPWFICVLWIVRWLANAGES
jgi:GH15 family glucan-1,4-alpha-glucosidase